MIDRDEVELIKYLLRIQVAVRTADGIPAEDLAALRAALSNCERLWLERGTVGAPVAAVLVGFSSSISASAAGYSEERRLPIIKLLIELEEEFRNALNDGSVDLTGFEL